MATPTDANKLGLDTNQFNTVIEAYTKGFHNIMYLCIPCAGLGLLATILMITPCELFTFLHCVQR